MIKNLLILVLTALLTVSSYLLYDTKKIQILIHDEDIQHSSLETSDSYDQSPYNDSTPAPPNVDLSTPRNKQLADPTLMLSEGFVPEIHTDPVIALSIGPDHQIMSGYKVIGPKKFVILSENNKPVVKIDLQSGSVEVDENYDIDDASREFWRSVAKKYPEVCFVE